LKALQYLEENNTKMLDHIHQSLVELLKEQDARFKSLSSEKVILPTPNSTLEYGQDFSAIKK
jgi:hypothetical protein